MGKTSVTQSAPLPNIHVLIVAAGSGTRFDGASVLPKQYQNLNGQSILRRAIIKFKKLNKISSINCIIDPNYKDEYIDAASDLGITPYTKGGKTRKQSVYNGLLNLPNVKNEDIVLIHDAARPLVDGQDILNIIESLNVNRAATLATPVAETLRKGNNDKCADIVPRDGLWAMQTPQAFRYADILKAHEAADLNTKSNLEHTDDTSLVTAIGIDVKLVRGNAENFKITTKDDLKMAEKIVSSQSIIRTGLGYDVHAFDIDSKGPIRLCGIDVSHAHKLKGHSDADVGLHAITDAILGALAEGDIGQHFPPSDNTYKDMDSAVFLEKTMQIVKNHNATINNIDLCLICEEPKIGPHAKEMRTRVAAIMKIDESAINIKATTSEKLGFTGRKEGIAAQAIATVTINA